MEKRTRLPVHVRLWQKYPKIDAVQQRAIRVYLGVHCYAPTLALNGDCGWTYSIVRRKTAAVRFWNRLLSLDNSRITKRVFLWDKQHNKGWASQMKGVLTEVGFQDSYNSNEVINTSSAWALFHEKECQKWATEIRNFPKLRTYVNFKLTFSIEPYVFKILSRRRRSLMAKLRMGILPLAIETGRWRSLPIEERVCTLCNAQEVEDEKHFMFVCSFHEYHRTEFFRIAENVYPGFLGKDLVNKWKIIMSECLVNQTCIFVEKIFDARQAQIYFTR